MQQARKKPHSTKVCTFCKRRKVRCDKGTPCQACVKYGNPICEYPPETSVRNVNRASNAESGFTELVLNLDPAATAANPFTWKNGDEKEYVFERTQEPAPLRKRSSTINSASSAGSSSSLLRNTMSTNSAGSAPFDGGMHSELEILKNKISMLENSMNFSGNPQGSYGISPGNGQGSSHMHGYTGAPTSHDGSTNSSANSTKRSPISPLQPVQIAASSTSQPIWKNPDPTAEDEFRFMIGKNPYVSDSQYFSFHNSYVPFVAMGTTNVRHYYPLNWVSLIKLDPTTSPLFAMKHSKVGKKRHVVLRTTTADPLEPSDRVFNQKLKEFVDEEGAYDPAPCSDEKKLEKLKKINQRARAIGLTVYEGDLDAIQDVATKASLLLPGRKIIWTLIDRFFRRVYPFFPFLDQVEFEGQVSQLLGGTRSQSLSEDDTKVGKIKISKKIELIYLGLLLLVLRLSYLTLFTNCDVHNEANLFSEDPSPKAQRIRTLMNNPIDVEACEVAQECLSQFGYVRYSNLSILQLSLYLKIYYTYAPENGEGADDSNSQGYCSRIIDMAMSLGLHREPDHFRSKVRDDRTNNLCRKIWWYLLMSDMKGALTNGSPLTVKNSQFDTLPPFHKSGNENIRDISLEIQVIHSIAQIEGCYGQLYKVVSSISEVRTPIPMRQFCEDLSELESHIPGMIEQISNSLYPPSRNSIPSIEISNAHLLKVGFQSAFFSVGVNFHFFIAYEKMGEMNLAYYYLKKLLSFSVFRMMHFHESFAENSIEIFHNTTDLSITPLFQTLVHKCTIIIHCIELRARFSILKMEASPTHQMDLQSNHLYKRRYELLNETFALCEACLKVFLKSMKRMSSRYYYCWRYAKAQEALAVIRNGTDYYKVWCRGKETFVSLTDEMLEDLNSVLQKSIQMVKGDEPHADQIPEPSGQDSGHSSIPASGSPSTYLNDQESDAMWAQMLSMKPNPADGVYSQTSDYANTGLGYDPNFTPDYEVAGAGFYDEILRDIMAQNPQF